MWGSPSITCPVLFICYDLCARGKFPFLLCAMLSCYVLKSSWLLHVMLYFIHAYILYSIPHDSYSRFRRTFMFFRCFLFSYSCLYYYSFRFLDTHVCMLDLYDSMLVHADSLWPLDIPLPWPSDFMIRNLYHDLPYTTTPIFSWHFPTCIYFQFPQLLLLYYFVYISVHWAFRSAVFLSFLKRQVHAGSWDLCDESRS